MSMKQRGKKSLKSTARLKWRAGILTFLYISTVIIASLFVPKEIANADSILYVTSASAFNNAAIAVTVDKPAGTIQGDVMVAIVALQGTGTWTTPTGWTSRGGTVTGSLSLSMHTFTKVAGASEPSSYTFTSTNLTTRVVGSIASYRGVDNTTPVDQNGTINTGSATSVPATSITTGVARTRVVGLYSTLNIDPRTITPASDMTERAEVASNDGFATNADPVVEISDRMIVASGTSTGSETATVSASSDFAAKLISLKPDGVTHMMLLWDGTGSAPTGWSFVTDFDGKFLRGETPANFGVTGGAATHNHTASGSITAVNANGLLSGIGSAVSSFNHTHTAPTATPDAANNSPAHRTLRLIRYDAGIPNVVPANAISIFDSSPGIPSGWTEQTARRDLLIKINTNDTSCMTSTCGADSHTHNINWSNLAAASGSANRLQLFGTATATTNHTHTISDSNSASTSLLPPYAQPLIAKADSDIALTSIGLMAFFDGEPGGGWVKRSVSGQPFYQQFLRPAATYNGTSQGSSTHTHANSTQTTSSSVGGNGGNTSDVGSNIADQAHTHTVQASGFNTVNHEPEYFNIVVAEKVNFIFSQYAWYDDNNANLPTSRWSSLDIAHNSAIITIPTANGPPDLDTELRLRIQILANNNNLGVNEIQYRLQFKEGTDGSCTTGTWTDVGNNGDSVIWKYAVSGVADGASLSGGVGFSPASDRMQRYVRSKSAGTNPTAVNVGERMEWDYHIMHNGALGATKYSFRVVEEVGGLLLSQYDQCPTLSTKSQPGNQLRHGNFFESDGTEKGFSWVD